MSPGPLVETLARRGDAEAYLTLVAGPPPGDDWVGVDRVLEDPAVLDGWFAEAMGALDGHRDAAASLLAGWLGGVLVEPAATALWRQGRAWVLEPARLAVHRHPEGWFDGLAVDGATVLVLPDDPAAGAAGVEVLPDLDALRARFAAEAVAVLTPLFDAVRARGPFGLAGMWGSLADGLAGGAVWGARDDGGDGVAAFAEADRLVDAIASLEPRLRVRSTLLTVPCAAGEAHAPRRGTCCLWYKRAAEPTTADYCMGCSLHDLEEQRASFAAYLDGDVDH